MIHSIPAILLADLQFLTDWFNGPYAGKTILVMRILFFVLFIGTAFSLCFGGADSAKRPARRKGLFLLPVLFSIGLLAIFAYQVTWQLLGTQKPEMMRFMRRHNDRPGLEVRRGSIVDRNGILLAYDDPEVETPGHRRYPLGAAAAHVIGYYDPRYGITGLEKAADRTLTGSGKSATEELQRLGRNIVDNQPAEGGDVRLALDARLQRACSRMLEGKTGAIVVLRPDTGEILALVSSPSFDPARPGLRYAGEAPLLNRAVQGRYPPGSTFKVAMSLLAADLGKAPSLDCPAGGFSAAKGAKPIRDVEYYQYERKGLVWHGFGTIGLRDALVHSSNVYFAQLALLCPASRFNAFVEKLSIASSFPLYGEGAEALVATGGGVPVVRDADRRMRAQIAIGQGKLALSPLHVAMWTAVAANDGLLAPPRLAYAPAEGTSAGRRVVSKAAARNVAAMMRDVVRYGTGRRIDLPGLGVSGKTGTAQAPGGADHSWFTCFTATTKPRIVVTVLIERGGYGSRAALPVAKEVLGKAEELGIIEGRTHGKTK